LENCVLRALAAATEWDAGRLSTADLARQVVAPGSETHLRCVTPGLETAALAPAVASGSETHSPLKQAFETLPGIVASCVWDVV
jgi:hypothetical protein